MPYSWAGVEVFFVISGFVIPYALLGMPFKGKHYGGYIIKRLVRIEPAYLASIVLILVLNYISTLFSIYAGPPFTISIQNIIFHLGYLVEFFDVVWLNPVYWTLAVEFHYYLVVGFLLILWNKNNKYLTIISLLLFFALSFIPQDTFRFLKYTDIFTIGMLGAFYKRDYFNIKYYLLFVAIVTAVIYSHHNAVITFLCVFAILGMTLLDNVLEYKWLLFIGNISYSLYLLHVPIGGRVVNIARRFDLGIPTKVLVVFLALGISILAAYIFYVFIEKPSHRRSRKLKLKLE